MDVNQILENVGFAKNLMETMKTIRITATLTVVMLTIIALLFAIYVIISSERR